MSKSLRRSNICEGMVKGIWQHQLTTKRGLATSKGGELRVVYPGKPNSDRGPDFLNAIIILGKDEAIKGDIEIHDKSSRWQAHGHHQDPSYNGVILHVVMWHDSQGPTTLENGKFAPVLALHPWARELMAGLYHISCQPLLSGVACHKVAERLGIEGARRLLDALGEERFQAKSHLFQQALTREEEEQVLYRGIMGALGYARNSEPFQELARRLPLRSLGELASGRTPYEHSLALQALFLGTAGLLPCQRRRRLREEKEEFVGQLERVWHSIGSGETMSEADWSFFKVRPENFPTRRLAAASYLLARYSERGPLSGMLRMVREASLERGHHQLEEGLMVNAEGYWASHFDFGQERKPKTPTLLGWGRAAEIVVNVILPFVAAWGRGNFQPELKEKAGKLYEGYPKLAENKVTQQMRLRLFPGGSPLVINTARQQQGLIHIYKGFCAEGRCSRCPWARNLGQAEAGHHIQIPSHPARNEAVIALDGNHSFGLELLPRPHLPPPLVSAPPCSF